MTLPEPKKFLENIPKYEAGKSVDALQQNNLISLIKLASNENMLGPSVSPQELMLSLADIHVYPDQNSHVLMKALEQKHQLSKEQFILGNGSDECLDLICRCYAGPGDEVLSSEHTFSIYAISCKSYGANYIAVPLKNWVCDLEAILKAVTDKTKIIFIANPNNPTGTFLLHEELKIFLEKIPSHVIVVLDEAYKEFVTNEACDKNLTFIHRFDNVVITRTFSKLYGLAGLRVGYAISSEHIIKTLKQIKPPFNINKIALDAAFLALSKTAYIEHSLQLIQQGKIQYELASKNWPVLLLKSEANFVCFLLERHTGKDVFNYLLSQGVICRDLASFKLPNAFRISLGTREQNEKVIYSLDAFFKK
jgi:histidinol-phosphate aminotransferase